MQRIGTPWLPRVGTTLARCLCCASIAMPVLAALPARAAPPARLDLRPPAAGDFGSAKSAEATGDERRGFARFAAQLGSVPIASRAESLAIHFRHEGLPVAKLWQNEAAFISLGLSPRGKPGIWLVQKTH